MKAKQQTWQTRVSDLGYDLGVQGQAKNVGIVCLTTTLTFLDGGLANAHI